MDLAFNEFFFFFGKWYAYDLTEQLTYVYKDILLSLIYEHMYLVVHEYLRVAVLFFFFSSITF